jgi:DNA-binding LytR/AlgR family response regulator
MLKIAICDDESASRAVIHGFLLQMLAKSIEYVDIYTYSSGSELLDNYPKGLDVLLLDIMMENENGIEIAKKIRKFDTKVQIVFITNLPQFAIECYKVHAFGYLLKPLTYSAFRIQMSELLKHLSIQGNKGLVIKNGTLHRPIQYRDILYVETYKKKLLIHTKSDQLIYEATISQMEEQLAAYGFIRCHHSYLVNMSYIKGISKNDILLKNEEQIPVSRAKKNECLQALTLFLGEVL